jgi:aspartate/methionine/tyrosine aminotransferase
MRAVDGVIDALASHGGPASSWLVGEPCVAPPEILREALSEAARAQHYDYPPPAGSPQLRAILAARHAEGSSTVSPDQVVVTHGAKGGLFALFATLLGPGDEIIHPVPGYPAYSAMAHRLGARPVAVPESDGSFEGWAESVSGHIGKRTRAIVIASPSNPTGATLDLDQASTLVDLCREHKVRLLCDEAYADFRFSNSKALLPADLDPSRETVVQVRSTSKSWALCGWRIGWIVTDASLASQVASTHDALLNPASGPAQQALLALPDVPDEYLERSRAIVGQRMDDLCAALNDKGMRIRRPDAGFYVWLDVRPALDEMGSGTAGRWCLELARREGVGLWPGDDFGGSDRVRIAVTAPDDVDWDRSLAELVRQF